MLLKRIDGDTEIKVLYESSNILASTLNKNSNELIIIFTNGGRYKYTGLSKTDYTRFELADSQGVVFNSHIKKYPFEKLDSVDVDSIKKEITDLKEEEKIVLKTEAFKNLHSIISSLDSNAVSYTLRECENLTHAITKYIKTL